MALGTWVLDLRRITVFAKAPEARASAEMLLQPYGLSPAFSSSERNAGVCLSESARVGDSVLDASTLHYASLANCFSRKFLRHFKLYLAFAKTGLRVPSLFKKMRPKKKLVQHSDEAARLRMAFAGALHEEKIVGSRLRTTPAFLFTHDVDSESSLKKIPELLALEESFGIRSFWFVLSGLREKLFARFPELEERSFSHGFKHDGTLLSGEATMREHLRQSVWNRGFRAPWLHHSTALFGELAKLGVRFDSSIPNFENMTHFIEPGGCGEIIPFDLFGRNFKKLGVREYPVTLYQDYAFYNRYGSSDGEILDYYRGRIDFLAENGGLVNLLTHPDEKDSGSQRGLKNYGKILEHACAYRKFWLKKIA